MYKQILCNETIDRYVFKQGGNTCNNTSMGLYSLEYRLMKICYLHRRNKIGNYIYFMENNKMQKYVISS